MAPQIRPLRQGCGPPGWTMRAVLKQPLEHQDLPTFPLRSLPLSLREVRPSLPVKIVEEGEEIES